MLLARIEVNEMDKVVMIVPANCAGVVTVVEIDHNPTL